MSSSKIGDKDYECPTCMNPAKFCGCATVDEISTALCGSIDEDAILLAVNIADGYLRPVPLKENMLFTKQEWLDTPDRFSDQVTQSEFDRIGIFGRYQTVNWMGVPRLFQCTLSDEETARLEQMFGVSQEKILETIDKDEIANIFAQRYGGRTKEQVEAQGFDGRF